MTRAYASRFEEASTHVVSVSSVVSLAFNSATGVAVAAGQGA